MKRRTVNYGLTAALLVLLAGGAVVLTRWSGGPAGRAELERTMDQSGHSGAGRAQSSSNELPVETSGAGETGARYDQLQSTSTGNSSLNPQQLQAVAEYAARNELVRAEPGSFSIGVGGSVPRQIRLEALPPELTDLLGRYRGDEYVRVRDSLVVVEPNVRRIVAVIPLRG
jgi:hypothetical protein